ncbi:MAG TPA: YebC/PmpR family DNA-binding transcriptional regulator [Acidimicrobiales bacterium]|nr:YebC/PmpR family DNA-binding transcriptional regulator [Acidimicrobiales bacterium]
MSGHSKWATTKYRKGAQDAARSKRFVKHIRSLEVAAREGGGDLTNNAALRTAFERARGDSMPMDTIERAIKRGTGELEGVRYEAVSYEGYAPGGVAVIVETLTDNRNRTSAELRNLFTRNGGSLAEPGAVSWQFERKGVVELDRSLDEDTITEAAADAGAEDVVDVGERWQVVSAPTDLAAVRAALEAAGMTPLSSELTLVPTATVDVGDSQEAQRVLRLLDAIEEHDDVQNVHANYDIPEAVLAGYAG